MTLQLYDVAMRAPIQKHACTPNPWKAHLALNLKSVPYNTTWVQLPEIAKTRQSLSIPACRKFADGTDFYTLPILVDPSTSAKLGDSFDIAVYLQKQYPENDLFPPQPLDYVFKPETESLVPLSGCNETVYPEYARFNMYVDAAFTAHIILMAHAMPFDPAHAEACQAVFLGRAGLGSWDDLALTGDARKAVLDSFERTLGGLAGIFTKTDGPFILEKPSYADLIVCAWLMTASRTLPAQEWETVKGWHGGVFGRLFDALQVYAVVH
jgi:glutathione S-transferase